MNILNFDFSSLLFTSGAIIGIAVISILSLLNRDKSLGINLLILFLLCMINVLFSNVAYQTDFFLTFPHFYRLLSFTSCCIGPLSYLYVRTNLNQSYKLNRYDWLLFLPAAAYLIHRIPFIILPADEKIIIIRNALEKATPVMAEPEGLMPEGLAAVLRLITGIGFIIAQFWLLISYKKKTLKALIPLSEQATLENNARFKWLTTFSLTMLAGYLFAMLSTFLQLSQNKYYGNYTTIIVALSVIVISFVLFTKPYLLYGMTGWFKETIPSLSSQNNHISVFSNPDPANGQEDKTGTISEVQRIEILESINAFIRSSELFLTTGFTIRDMSKAVGIPLYLLSAFINQEFNKNFNEWLNDIRIDHFLKKLSEDQRMANYTLQHIGEQLGFRSRTSFIAAVKKRTGKTPSELVSELN